METIRFSGASFTHAAQVTWSATALDGETRDCVRMLPPSMHHEVAALIEVFMRFEVIAALAVGILLPLLETARRGISYWAVDFTTMFEDYVAGALLLVGAWATYRRRAWGSIFLVLAWGSIFGLISSSFWGQLEETLRHTASEPNNLLVVIVKFLLWVTCVVSLVLSFRRAIQLRST